MMRILYVRFDMKDDNGGHFVSERNLRILQKIVGQENVYVHFVSRLPVYKFVWSLLTFSSYNMTPKIENDIVNHAVATNCNFVFIEGSLMGRLIKKLRYHSIRVVLFAHNVDSELVWQHYLNHRSVAYAMYYHFVKYNEKMSLRYADNIISLNLRDANLMAKIYRCSASIILPITFPKQLLLGDMFNSDKPYCLFVGSNFFPNVEGIKWFIVNVAPFINYDVRIVGSCCENVELRKINCPSNVYFEGFVPNLSKYYRAASFVIAPIFSGSGMKTKTIEAMSFGKSIVGTLEAFVGIDCDYERIGGKCETSDEFINTIANTKFQLVNEYTISLFNECYSDDVYECKLKQFIFKMYQSYE